MTIEVEILEWGGTAAGVAGAAVLALDLPWSWVGWVLFLVSNLLWIGYGLTTNTWSLVTMQGVFTATSFLGLYRWRFGRRGVR